MHRAAVSRQNSLIMHTHLISGQIELLFSCCQLCSLAYLDLFQRSNHAFQRYLFFLSHTCG